MNANNFDLFPPSVPNSLPSKSAGRFELISFYLTSSGVGTVSSNIGFSGLDSSSTLSNPITYCRNLELYLILPEVRGEKKRGLQKDSKRMAKGYPFDIRRYPFASKEVLLTCLFR